MWPRLRDALAALVRFVARKDRERSRAETRTRFWSELREGQREAEARSRPRSS
jgi:hypothetical protein